LNARFHAIVHGQVQGVFFRAHTLEEGAKLDLSGWVMNTREGDVEVEAEGEKAALQKLLDWLKKGPAAARVDKVESEWKGYVGDMSGFRIRYW